MDKETVEGGIFVAERAERMEHFSISPSAALMAKVTELRRQGKDIISLNVGEPDFETPAHIRQAAADAMNSGFTHYTTESGIPELRQAIFCTMMVIAQPGDEVLLPVSCWVSYTEMIRLAGAKPVFVPVRSDNYELDLDAIESAITSRTKAIVLCTPNNPTGAVYSEESLRRLAALAALEKPQKEVTAMTTEFCRRRDFIVHRLNEMEGMSCPDVHGAFYVYPDVSAYFGKHWKEEHITNSVELCRYLLDEALVAVVPGEAFNLPGKICISYSNSMENLE